MPDITMCTGSDCPQKRNCYRFRAIPKEQRQSYFSIPPYKMDGCDYFSLIRSDDVLQKDKKHDDT